VFENTPLPPGSSVQCTVTAEDDFLIGRLAADLSAAKRVDLCMCDEHGVEQIRLTDIPFNSAAGSIAFQQPITYAKTPPSENLIARLVALDDSSREHLLGEYTLNHTRTLPGPGVGSEHQRQPRAKPAGPPPDHHSPGATRPACGHRTERSFSLNGDATRSAAASIGIAVSHTWICRPRFGS